ncbi:hypothetical protein CPB84DRAFT_1855085 [Gymnopilus junonius]|uniref:Uncharacterized protein n=1 Tax=Gymnopilus junonius TaxID=109634 RepID=A0A9P5NA44_GYMJU|nr:hypothetical protein CPB84DRAFT_1855085 [Gymnopilus junonius]
MISSSSLPSPRRLFSPSLACKCETEVFRLTWSLTPIGRFLHGSACFNTSVAVVWHTGTSDQPDVPISSFFLPQVRLDHRPPPPPFLAPAADRAPLPRLQMRWMLFAPCEGFNSSRVLLSRVRGPERTAAAVGSPSGMSAQPDIPIFVSTPPPSWVGGFLAHAEVKPLHSAFSRAGRVRRVALAARMPYGTSIYPDMPISFISPPPAKARWRLFACFLCMG